MTGFDRLMAAAQRLAVSLEALAALGAVLRDADGEATLHPAVSTHAAAVVTALDLDAAELGRLAPAERQAAAGMIRAFVTQASDLLERPGRAPGWTWTEPSILDSQGRLSLGIAPVIQRVAPALGDLADRLQRPGATFLDVGTGAGWLALAMANTYPRLQVVGIDVWQPSLDLATVNTASVADRVSLRLQDVRNLADEGTYDAIFLPGPFLPRAVVPVAVARSLAALRPGGWLLFGLCAAPPEDLAARLMNLRIVRSGGHPWMAEEVGALLTDSGLAEVHLREREWQMPLAFVVGRRAGP